MSIHIEVTVNTVKIDGENAMNALTFWLLAS